MMRARGPAPSAAYGIAIATAALLLVPLGSAASAAASTWFAAADGDGSPPCRQVDPCEILDAVEGAPAGTRVAPLAGTYHPASPIVVDGGVTLRGPWGGPPALFAGDGSGATLTAEGDGSRVADVAVEASGSGSGIGLGDGAVATRILSTTSGSGAACVPSFDGLLTDSVCAATDAGGGNGVLIDEEAPGTGSVRLVNVTAISDGSEGTSAALLARASGGAGITVEATNLIASALGPAPDIAVGALIGGSRAEVTLVNSNYDAVAEVGPEAIATPPGTGSNQAEPPVFEDAAVGDFSPGAGSPTIDAGIAPIPELGLLDVLRAARIQGAAPDIGAHEHVAPPDLRAPRVSITSAPRGKLKTRKRFVDVTFELVADEQDVTFECRLNSLPARECTSPVSYRLEAGRAPGLSYLLAVRAVDAAGNRSAGAIRTVQVIRAPRG